MQIQVLRNWNVNLEFLEGTIRSGKTHILVEKFFLKSYDLKYSGGIHVILSKTQASFTRNILPIINSRFPDAEFRVGGALGPRVHWKGLIIYIISYSNAKQWEKLLGSNVATALLDEVNLVSEYFLSELIGRATAVEDHYIGLTGNPDDPELEVYNILNKCTMKNPNTNPNAKYFIENKPNWHTWAMTFLDNPILTTKQINNLINSFHQDSIYFQTKIKGERRRDTGLIFGDMVNKVPISYEEAKTKRFELFSVGVDTAYSTKSEDTIAFSFEGITNKGELLFIKEWVHNNRNGVIIAASELPPIIEAFVAAQNAEWGGNVKDVFIDSADANLINECNKYRQSTGSSLNFYPAHKKMKIIDRINALGSWIHTGHYRVIDTNNIHLKELRNYSWNDNEKLVPKSGSDHTIDAGSYGWIPYRTRIGTHSL